MSGYVLTPEKQVGLGFLFILQLHPSTLPPKVCATISPSLFPAMYATVSAPVMYILVILQNQNLIGQKNDLWVTL